MMLLISIAVLLGYGCVFGLVLSLCEYLDIGIFRSQGTIYKDDDRTCAIWLSVLWPFTVWFIFGLFVSRKIDCLVKKISGKGKDSK